jgi:hypothetical protein
MWRKWIHFILQYFFKPQLWNETLLIFRVLFSRIFFKPRRLKYFVNYRSCRVAGIWMLQHRGMLWWLPDPTEGLDFQCPMLLFPLFCVFSEPKGTIVLGSVHPSIWIKIAKCIFEIWNDICSVYSLTKIIRPEQNSNLNRNSSRYSHRPNGWISNALCYCSPYFVCSVSRRGL